MAEIPSMKLHGAKSTKKSFKDAIKAGHNPIFVQPGRPGLILIQITNSFVASNRRNMRSELKIWFYILKKDFNLFGMQKSPGLKNKNA